MTGPRFHVSSGSLPPIASRERSTRVLKELARGGAAFIYDDGLRALLESVAGNSPYLARGILAEREFLSELFAQGPDPVLSALNDEALSVATPPDVKHPLIESAAMPPGASEVMRALRIVKRRVALAVALADIGGAYDLEAVTGALTRFADCAVRGALGFLLAGQARKKGLAETAPETLEATTGFIVLAMGKHGAFELNYSSDIDLVVFYDIKRFPFAVQGEKGRAAVELVKGLLRLLAEPTADGYVFRVDLRLRPDAGVTQVAISTEAAELYYESMGQNWERAAMIKARACAGDGEASAAFLRAMIPFVWRKYLDYAAIEDIHSIKRQIHAHGGHERIAVLGHNVKLGRGGIREIEFFAQTQQLILGGRDPSLRERTTLGALAALRGRGLISVQAESDLAAAYRFLRKLEHRLQMIEDEQTHTIPKTADGLDHIARFMGYGETQNFENALLHHLHAVQFNYAQLFEAEAPLTTQSGSLVFTGVEDDPETLDTLAAMGFSAPGDVAGIIRGWHHGRLRATRSTRARERLTKLMPALLDALSNTADPHSAFIHFDRFLSGLPSGVQVFSLLLANPELLRLVAEIAGSAPRLAEYLGRNAAVLDALIDVDFLTTIPNAGQLRERWAAELARGSGFEGGLDAARRFAREETFRIGVQVIEGKISAEHAGPAYAAVAETVIAGLQPLVEAEMATAHGRLAGGSFAVVAQGKLGGREMTASSDLDLVFLYDHADDAEASDGPRPLTPSQYFTRISQRFITALTALTAEGRLYEVDMRLRPSGNQGPLAVRLDTFLEYHRRRSWTWERLALTRARVVSGPEELRAKVEEAVRGALVRPMEPAAILCDAREMRDKLARKFSGSDPWDIKFAFGGLVDIEFIAQALQLCHAPSHHVLDQNTIAALGKLARAGVLAGDDAEVLIVAARLEHTLTQVLRIAIDGPFKPNAATPGLKNLLARAAGDVDFAALEARLVQTQAHVRAIFEKILPPIS